MTEASVQSQIKAVLIAAEPQLFVADVRASCDFFVQKLGFKVSFVYGEPPYYGQVARDGARINLRCVDVPVVDPARRDRESLLSTAITVATRGEIEMLYQEFKSAGVVFAQASEEQVWGSTNFVVKDGDGNLLLFAGPSR